MSTVIDFPASRRRTPANDVIAIPAQHAARAYVPPVLAAPAVAVGVDAVKAEETEQYLAMFLELTGRHVIQHVGVERAAELMARTGSLIRATVIKL